MASDGLAPQQRLALVTDATVAAGSARMILDQTISAEALPGGPQTTSGEGVFSLGEEQRGAMSLTVPGATAFDLWIDGDTIYYRFPKEQRRALKIPTPWVGVDTAELAGGGGRLQQLNNNPVSQLDLVDVIDGAEEVGDDVLRGDTVTHLSGTLDLGKAAQRLPKDSRATIEQLSTLGLDAIPVDIWIDEENRLRKLSMNADLKEAIAQSGGSGAGSLEQTFEMFDFGVEIPPTAPPPDQVTDLRDVPELRKVLTGQS